MLWWCVLRVDTWKAFPRSKTPMRYLPHLRTWISFHHSFPSRFVCQRRVRHHCVFTPTRPSIPAPGTTHTSSYSHPLLLHLSLSPASTAEPTAQAPSPPRENQVSQPQRERLQPAKSQQPRCCPLRHAAAVEPPQHAVHRFSATGKTQP